MPSDFAKSRIVWSVVLHSGIGRRAKRWQFGFDTVNRLCELSERRIQLDSNPRNDYKRRLDRFKKAIKESFDTTLPDAYTFQEIFTRRVETEKIGPEKALEVIRDLVEKHFPKQRFSLAKIENKLENAVQPQVLPIRIATGLFAAEYVAFLVNNHARA